MKVGTRRTRLFVIAVLGGAALVLVGLPLILLTLPDPVPIQVADLKTQPAGTFIQTDSGIFRLYGYTAPAPIFPKDPGRGDPGTVVFVRARVLDDLAAYNLKTFENERTVAVEKAVMPDGALKMRPLSPLTPGRYVISASRGGMYGGTDYFYLEVGLHR